MSRNGSGVYSKPAGTTFVPNTVIESSRVNEVIDDIAADLNLARPIVAGGTGASTAIAAGDNLSTKGADIASATTTDIGAATGRYINITGTTTITGLGTKTAGVVRICTFTGSLTLTHNATSLILPGGANIQTAANDVAVFVSEGSGNWRCANYSRASDNWVDVASATTTDIGAVASENVRVTGTTTITGLGTVAAGTFRRVRFAGILTLTHNGTSLILPTGGNITTAAGDVFAFISEGSGNWRCVGYQLATGRALSGNITQVQSQFTGAVSTGTTQIPQDDTIPQITEGDEYLTVTITPTNASSTLEIEAQVVGSLSSGATCAMALFKVGTSDALCATNFASGGTGTVGIGTLKWRISAGSTSAQTFKVRAGPSSAAATFTFNGSAGARRFGGVMNSFIVVNEMAP